MLTLTEVESTPLKSVAFTHGGSVGRSARMLERQAQCFCQGLFSFSNIKVKAGRPDLQFADA
jgi:hypothetical protein